MRFLPIIPLLLLAPSCSLYAQEDNSEGRGVTVKCGRDSAYVVLNNLGRRRSLDWVDDKLERRDFVSLEQLKILLEQEELSVLPVKVAPENLPSLSESLANCKQRWLMIVALNTPDRALQHFAVCNQVRADRMLIIDPGKGHY
jgi:ABC-type bacteriocin/lantibiotic exporter with double-glycine peptidase domain